MVLDQGVPMNGCLVLWARLVRVMRCCLQVGGWSKGCGNKTDMSLHTWKIKGAVVGGFGLEKKGVGCETRGKRWKRGWGLQWWG